MRKLISIILIMLLIFSSIVTTLSLAYEEVNDVKEEIKNNDESGAVTMCLQLLFV